MKNLKKIIIAFASVLSIAVSFTACGSESGDDLVGEWTGKEPYYSGNVTYTFNESGTCSFERDAARGAFHFTWDVDGDTLVLTESDEHKNQKIFSYSLSDKGRELTLTYEGSSESFTLYKVS